MALLRLASAQTVTFVKQPMDYDFITDGYFRNSEMYNIIDAFILGANFSTRYTRSPGCW